MRLSLKGWACFSGVKDIEIAPLTVLSGMNGTGKTSVLQAIEFLGTKGKLSMGVARTPEHLIEMYVNRNVSAATVSLTDGEQVIELAHLETTDMETTFAVEKGFPVISISSFGSLSRSMSKFLAFIAANVPPNTRLSFSDIYRRANVRAKEYRLELLKVQAVNDFLRRQVIGELPSVDLENSVTSKLKTLNIELRDLKKDNYDEHGKPLAIEGSSANAEETKIRTEIVALENLKYSLRMFFETKARESEVRDDLEIAENKLSNVTRARNEELLALAMDYWGQDRRPRPLSGGEMATEATIFSLDSLMRKRTDDRPKFLLIEAGEVDESRLDRMMQMLAHERPPVYIVIATHIKVMPPEGWVCYGF